MSTHDSGSIDADYEARCRLTAFGWTLNYTTAWPEAESIPVVEWIAPGKYWGDGGPWELFERSPYFGDFFPPIPDEVLETLA